MDCEKNQMRAGLLSDAALDGSEQIELYRHLEGCVGCRSFVESTIRFHNAMRADREEIESNAGEVLGLWDPVEVAHLTNARRILRPRSPGEPLFGRLRFPVLLAIGLAAALLVFGMFIGGRMAGRSAVLPAREGTVESSRPVVVVCGFPEVEVVADQVPGH